MEENRYFIRVIILAIVGLAISCTSPSEKKAAVLYNTHCASCHLLPAIDDLPKHIWKNGVLPDMTARMGIKDSTVNPYKNVSFTEQHAIMQTGIYPSRPQLSLPEWHLLKEYIISLAPDSLRASATKEYKKIEQFEAVPIQLDSTKGTFITFLQFDERDNSIISGDLKGDLLKYNFIRKKIDTLTTTGGPITGYTNNLKSSFITNTGNLNPSEIARGDIQINSKNVNEQLPFVLHRPVHTLAKDLNKNGHDELVICEFGNFTGSLSLLSKENNGNYKKEILINQPGFIRTIAKDMNGDGKDDLITLASQGKESIFILYQQGNLEFTIDPVIKFSPVYGTSWFELIDYDGDGDDDLITVHGDNADKSYVHKPYHGLRIHINDGTNHFEEKFFFPLNGATRVVVNDFDQDGDFDFGILSTFPDYSTNPESSFVYLENKNAQMFSFKPFTFSNSKLGRWLLLDSGDVDSDGDIDIILSSFTYGFTPVPKDFLNIWKDTDVDIMLLKNELN
ncbi:FG-GAP-like repeat-containing protein [Zobellia alginiliquefaciens]|uniref:FG-GAP-like repeat-containing protein n=1 Tax=Zobellia alginiliquefaciens TaxID=3032586 RepID=UPI0023E3CF0F|nr:FG-GAP-like repeat-containing protein [Zobellia alginiliquefaciens]